MFNGGIMKRVEYTTAKTCNVCNKEKDVSDFWNRSGTRKDGSITYRAYCKECGINKRLDKYYNKGGKEAQQKRAWKALMISYGITPELYEQERVKQNYCCYLCGEHESTQPHKRLHVDHCHTSGKYRGLLCNLCNMGLGSFKDNIEVMKKAIQYLKTK